MITIQSYIVNLTVDGEMESLYEADEFEINLVLEMAIKAMTAAIEAEYPDAGRILFELVEDKEVLH